MHGEENEEGITAERGGVEVTWEEVGQLERAARNAKPPPQVVYSIEMPRADPVKRLNEADCTPEHWAFLHELEQFGPDGCVNLYLVVVNYPAEEDIFERESLEPVVVKPIVKERDETLVLKL